MNSLDSYIMDKLRQQQHILQSELERSLHPDDRKDTEHELTLVNECIAQERERHAKKHRAMIEQALAANFKADA